MAASRVVTTADRELGLDVYPEEAVSRRRGYRERFGKLFPSAQLRRDATASYNCYGLVLAGRRGWVRLDDLPCILTDDGYRLVGAREAAQPGDIILYKDGGVIEHMGIVLELRSLTASSSLTIPFVLSKWGPGPEYVHHVAHSPFGTDYEIWTDRPAGAI